MSIDELIAVCPPPDVPLHARGDWAAVEARLGPLPADYKALIETYGSGRFGELMPLDPFDPNENVELVRVARMILDGDRETRRSFPEHLEGLPLHPEPGGLLPWAVHGNGGFVYWRMHGPPDRWPVMVLPSRELHGEEVAISATTLIARWLDGGDVPSALGDAEGARFVPSRASRS